MSSVCEAAFGQRRKRPPHGSGGFGLSGYVDGRSLCLRHEHRAAVTRDPGIAAHVPRNQGLQRIQRDQERVACNELPERASATECEVAQAGLQCARERGLAEVDVTHQQVVIFNWLRNIRRIFGELSVKNGHEPRICGQCLL